MLLRTLGAAYVERDDGAAADGALSQRRVLALLTVLAAAGEAGISRERVLGLFWPDADEDRARHALAQSLYHMKRALGAEPLLTSGSDLRLDASVVDSDLRRFEAAVRAGDLAAAAELYRGPFLDGFALPGSVDFDQWADVQRQRLSRRAAAVFDDLASRASAAGSAKEAVEWRRRQAAIDATDAQAALALMRATADAGDIGAALQHARVHEAIVHEQVGVPASPQISAFAAELRSRATAAPAAAAPPTAVSTKPAVVVATPAASVVSDIPAKPQAPDAAAHHPWRVRAAVVWKPLLWGALATAGGILGVSVARMLGSRADAAAPDAPQSIAIAPFRVGGADPGLAFLRDGLPELLTLRLADESATPSIDVGPVLTAFHRGDTASAGAGVSHALAVARRLGAQQVVLGSVVGSASHLVLSASLVDIADGEVARASVEGRLDSLTFLVDALARRLAVSTAGNDDALSAHTTLSSDALRSFLLGQAQYRHGHYDAAAREYGRALERDSTFALAALRLALAADRLNSAEQDDRALAVAWANRAELSTRDRAHLVAFAGPRYPAPSSAREQTSALARAIAIDPHRAEAWFDAGEEYLEWGRVLGLSDFAERASHAFRRALELQPNSAAARRQLIVAAARLGDTATLARFANPVALRDSLGPLGSFTRWRVAVAGRDSVTLGAIRDSLPSLSNANLRLMVMTAAFDAVGRRDAREALRIWRGHAADDAGRIDAILAAHALESIEGRPARARAIADELRLATDDDHAPLRLHVLDALYGDGDASTAEASARQLAGAKVRADASRSDEAIALADACILEQWRLAHGDSHATGTAIQRLRATSVRDVPTVIGTAPLACADMLQATQAVVENRPDALLQVQLLDSLMLSGPAIGDATTYAHLLVSRLYARLGRSEAALAAIRRRPYWSGWPRYLGTTRYEEGFLARAVGDTAGSRGILARYLAARDAAEPAVSQRIAAAKAAVR